MYIIINLKCIILYDKMLIISVKFGIYTYIEKLLIFCKSKYKILILAKRLYLCLEG